MTKKHVIEEKTAIFPEMVQKWFDVKVILPNDDLFYDAVWATNKKEAEIVAYWNWEEAAFIKVLN